MRKLYLSVGLFFVLIAGVSGQSGTLTGTVTDAKTNETLPGSTILIQGTTQGTITDFDGKFELSKIKPGTYNVVVSFVSYETQIQKVTIADSKTSEFNIQLKPVVVGLGEVQVVAKKRENTESSIITNMKTSYVIVSGISAQQIAKSQDKDAAEVIRRVPGITITDGRFVIVRGLIERYNSVMLNNATAPSFEADKRAFSFDVIPSGLIENILINKSPAPELPSDFAGAAINVKTKSVADENSLTIAYGSKYVQNSTFNKKFLTYQGSKTDWLGWDNGERAIPRGVPATTGFSDLYTGWNNETFVSKSSEILRISDLFNKNFTTYSKSPFPDQNFSATLQRRFVLGKVSFGNISSVNYSYTSEFRDIKRLEYQDYDATRDILVKDFDFADQRSRQNAKIGLIHNWNIIYGKNQKLEFRNFFNQLGSTSTTLRNGINYYNVETLRSYDLKYESRLVYSGQLAGEQRFNKEKTVVNWMAGYSYTNKKQPDNRRLTFVLNDLQEDSHFGDYYLRIQNVPNVYLGGRLWIDMDENVMDGKIDLTHNYKLFNSGKDWMLKTGFFYEKKVRNFSQRLIGLVAPKNPPDIFYKPITEILDKSNFYFDQIAPYNQNAGIAYREQTNAKDSYDAQDNLLAGYLGLNIPVTSNINLYGGVRVEQFHRLISGFYEKTDPTVNRDIKRDTVNFFPSANLTWNFNKKSLLRLSYGKTVNRPEFREMSDFDYQDFDLFIVVFGNGELKNSYIDNADLRYEWYPSSGEIISVGGFYKHFLNPIEVFLIPAGTGYNYKPFNTEKAYSLGTELDIRKQFSEFENSAGFFRFLKDFTVIFNASLINSKINTEKQGFARDKERIMQGQSPYIVNLGLFYQNQKNNFDVNLSYNKIGKRIAYVGTPDNPHTWELPRNSLDLIFQKAIGEKITLKAGIKDILNQPVKFVQYYGNEDQIEAPTLEYKPNREFSFSISIKI